MKIVSRQPAPERRDSVVRELPFKRATDEELGAQVRAGAREACAALFDRYGDYVERLLWGVLGPETEIEDLIHEIFLRAFAGIGRLDSAQRVRSWLAGITVHTAREWLRKRKRRWWLQLVEELPDVPSFAPSEEVSEATRCTFEVLALMKEDERIVFSLRFIEHMELTEIALACDLSLSTAKRRVKEAEAHFVARARRQPALQSWIEEGGRWTP